MTIAQLFRHRACRSALISAALLGATSIGSLVCTGVVLGADAAPVVNEKFGDFDPAIAELRQEVGQERRDLVKANMLLTKSEGLIFWPLYDQYRAERNKLGDRKVRLITDFAAHIDAMSQDEAERLTKEFLAIEKQKIEIKESYVAKMSKVLSARTVARFFQIDQKLDTAVDLALATQIPLMH